MKLSKYLVSEDVFHSIEVGDTFYTTGNADICDSYSLPIGSTVRVIEINEVDIWVRATHIDTSTLAEDLEDSWDAYDYWEDDYDEWQDCCWEEAAFRIDGMMYDSFMFNINNLSKENITNAYIYSIKPKFLVTPNKETKPLPKTKSVSRLVILKRRAGGIMIGIRKKLRFHRLSELLKNKTRRLLAKSSSLFKKKDKVVCGGGLLKQIETGNIVYYTGYSASTNSTVTVSTLPF